MTKKFPSKKKVRSGPPAKDAEPAILWRHAERFEPGVYRGYVRSTHTYWDRVFKRWVCLLQIDLFTDDLSEQLGRATCFYNLGPAKQPRAGRRSKFWAAWVRANGGPPKRYERVLPQIFVRRFAKVIVGDTMRDFEQRAVRPDAAYSVVREILEWETGIVSRDPREAAVHDDQGNIAASSSAGATATQVQSWPGPGSGQNNTTQSKGGRGLPQSCPPKATLRRPSRTKPNRRLAVRG
jgi:hypothetical protein